jgi:hypothetical protein
MSEPGQSDQGSGQSRNGVILILLVVAVGLGLWLVHTLRAKGQMEDCLMSGRHNCAPVAAGQG